MYLCGRVLPSILSYLIWLPLELQKFDPDHAFCCLFELLEHLASPEVRMHFRSERGMHTLVCNLTSSSSLQTRYFAYGILELNSGRGWHILWSIFNARTVAISYHNITITDFHTKCLTINKHCSSSSFRSDEPQPSDLGGLGGAVPVLRLPGHLRRLPPLPVGRGHVQPLLGQGGRQDHDTQER